MRCAFLANLTPLVFALGFPAQGQCKLARLGPPDGSIARFGQAVVANEDWIVVGAPTDDFAAKDAGTAYLFDRTGGKGVRLFRNDPEAGDWFGSSVGLAGMEILVGSPFDEDAGSFAGSAYIFDALSGMQVKKITAPDGAAFDNFGEAVLSAAGLWIVAAPSDEESGTRSGSVYVFDSTTGALIRKLLPSQPEVDGNFGLGLAVHGNRLLVGAPYEDGQFVDQGAVYLFDLTTGAELARIVAPSPTASAEFGGRVAIYGDRAFVGSVGAGTLLDLTTGLPLLEISVPGTSITVAMDADHLVYGGPGHQEPGFRQGSFWVFDYKGNELFAIHASDQSEDTLGWSLALVGDDVVVGAPLGLVPKVALVVGIAGPQGSSYCGPATLNSSGHSAELSGYGRSEAACNLLTLTASDLPPNVFAYPLTSMTKDFVPFPGGSQGYLCLGGTLGRFRHLVGSSDGSGSFSAALDLWALPPPWPPAVQAGETWNFQVWFRDVNPTPTSNFTDGLEVRFD
jgi:hypothetical protein